MTKKILFIGTLPPPIDGMTKATQGTYEVLLDLAEHVDIIDLSRRDLSRNFLSQLRRILSIFSIYLKLIKISSNYDHIYFTVSESTLGNIKDLIIYFLIYKKLDILKIHMLGGTGMYEILHKSRFLSKINKFFMQKMSGVIVEGPRGYSIFGHIFLKENIHILPNFVDDYLIISEDQCKKKYLDLSKINVLYLSHMIPEKGYISLLDAIELLPPEVLSNFEFNFVGGFQYLDLKYEFEERLLKLPMVNYLGDFIDGEEKKLLYASSHIFCLPTFCPFEGQPISILEAYISGCAVITTPHGGIPDIFEDKLNGLQVTPKSPKSLSSVFCSIALDGINLQEIGLRNRSQAYKHNIKQSYKSRVAQIFELE